MINVRARILVIHLTWILQTYSFWNLSTWPWCWSTKRNLRIPYLRRFREMQARETAAREASDTRTHSSNCCTSYSPQPGREHRERQMAADGTATPRRRNATQEAARRAREEESGKPSRERKPSRQWRAASRSFSPLPLPATSGASASPPSMGWDQELLQNPTHSDGAAGEGAHGRGLYRQFPVLHSPDSSHDLSDESRGGWHQTCVTAGMCATYCP